MPKDKKSKRKVGDKQDYSTRNRNDPSDVSPEKKPKIHLRKEDPTCTTCKLQFNNQQQLEQHLKVVHHGIPNMEIRCSICDIYFSTKDKLKKHNQDQHLRTNSSKRPSKSFQKPSSGNQSQLQSTKPPPGPPGPPVRSNSSSRFQQSKIDVSQEEEEGGEYYCEECGSEYATKLERDKHMAKAHEEEEVTSSSSKKVPGPTGRNVQGQFYQDDGYDEDDEMYDELQEMSVQNDIIIDGYKENEPVIRQSESRKLGYHSSGYIDASDYMDDVSEVSVSKRPDHLIRRSNFDFEVPVARAIPRDAILMAEYDDDVAEELDESDEEGIEEVLSSGIAKTFIKDGSRFERNHKIINDVSEDEEENYEYSSDEEDEIVPVSPVISRKTHEEVTLGDTDGEEESEEIIIEKEKENKRLEFERKHMSQYEAFLGNNDQMETIVLDPSNADKLQTLLNNAWFSKPKNWKPANPWETWNATVKQICVHYRIRDVQYDANQNFASFQDFNKYITPVVEASNPNRGAFSLYRWKKAKWLQSLDPVIPDHMKIVEESIDDDDD